MLQLIFVHCKRREFWLWLLSRCRDRARGSRGRARQPPANRAAATPTGTERVPLEMSNLSPAKGNRDDHMSIDTVKNDAVDEEALQKKLLETAKGLTSWKTVSEGLNRLFIVAYLLSNTLVFAFYLYPLLLRIYIYSSDSGYVVDNKWVTQRIGAVSGEGLVGHAPLSSFKNVEFSIGKLNILK